MKQVVKIEKKFDIATGEGRNGQWVRQDYLAVYGDKYPKSFVFSLMNDKVDKFKGLLSVGSEVELSFDIESREYNGKYYTNVTAWDVATAQNAAPAQNVAPAAPAEAPVVAPAIGNDDDLPF